MTADLATIPPKTLKKRGPKRRSPFTSEEIELVAKYQAEELMTQKEACITAGINYGSYVDWLSRNKNNPKHTEAFTRMRANHIHTCFGVLRDAAAGSNGFQKRDWRPAELMLRLADPARYSDRRNDSQSTTQPIIQVNVITEGLKRVYGTVEAKALPPVEPKQIRDANG